MRDSWLEVKNERNYEITRNYKIGGWRHILYKQAHLQRPEQATTLYTACTYYTTHTHTHTQTHAHIHTCTNSCSEGIQLRQATQGVGVCSFVRMFLLVRARGWKIQTPQNWNEARMNISVRCKFINSDGYFPFSLHFDFPESIYFRDSCILVGAMRTS